MNRPNRLVYALLAAVWAVVVIWQVLEHGRVKEAAQNSLLNRSRDITTTLGLVIQSQRRFGVVSQERIESALDALMKTGEINALALLNAGGEIVTKVGTPINLEAKMASKSGVRWETDAVTVVNLVDLGASVSSEGETNRPTIVLPRRDTTSPPRDDLRFPPRPPRPDDGFVRTNSPASGEVASTNRVERPPGPRRPPPGTFSRPFWMNEQQYQSLLTERGLHGLIIAMSTVPYVRAYTQDLWMRGVILCFAGMAVVGMGLAWRSLGNSAELQLRLLRASEQNTHLKEMNLAAAGLAHETKNPLNIIRGLAQIISQQPETPGEIRAKSRSIVDEADRVAAQVNEFINYSRPREVRRSMVALTATLSEVVRALGFDLEEKRIQLQVAADLPRVEADEQLLRQALFNLLLNAVQAVGPGGQINVSARTIAAEAILEIRDNGPGVPAEKRAEIFKPYFTMHQKGTGLGLAVVHQIVLAHGWEIECLANEPQGALFRLKHLKLASAG